MGLAVLDSSYVPAVLLRLLWCVSACGSGRTYFVAELLEPSDGIEHDSSQRAARDSSYPWCLQL